MLLLGINSELVLKELGITPAGMITDFIIPLGWLCQYQFDSARNSFMREIERERENEKKMLEKRKVN